MEKSALLAFSEEELIDWLNENGEPKYRARQIFHWIFREGVTNFEEMSNLSKSLRASLKEYFDISPLTLVQRQESSDLQTEKFLWRLSDSKLVESVLIKSGDRRTVCVSSQVGCNARCAFCASGKMGLMRNLSAGEIVQQVAQINNALREVGERVSHIVFMGMGEPLDNYENVIKAIKAITRDTGMAISQRRITVSTVGVVEGIHKFCDEGLSVSLVLSLHAPNQRVRKKIIPYARKYDIKDVLAAMERYAIESGRDVTYEYILIDGINADIDHAHELVQLLERKQCSVNLIPYNPVDGLNLMRPPKEKIDAFRRILEKSRVNATQRYTKGKDIAAACGQLALKTVEPV